MGGASVTAGASGYNVAIPYTLGAVSAVGVIPASQVRLVIDGTAATPGSISTTGAIVAAGVETVYKIDNRQGISSLYVHLQAGSDVTTAINWYRD